MELRQLRTFAVAAEAQNFTRAAEAMEVSQSAVSQHIAALELELGVALFYRGGRTTKLTDAGKHLYRYTRRALALLDKASRDVGDRVGDAPTDVSGTIHIATCTIPLETFLPQLLAAFRQAYPGVRESLSVSDAAEAARAVEEGSVDLGFVAIKPQGTRLHAKVITCHELMLVVSPEHRFASRGLVDVEELRTEPFILREAGSGTRQCVEQVLLDVGISPNDLTIALETNSNDAVHRAVGQGCGIALLTPGAAQDDIAQSRLVVVKVDDLHFRLNSYLITDPRRMPTAAFRAFLAFL